MTLIRGHQVETETCGAGQMPRMYSLKPVAVSADASARKAS
jgi:hypothetical protein